MKPVNRDLRRNVTILSAGAVTTAVLILLGRRDIAVFVMALAFLAVRARPSFSEHTEAPPRERGR